MCYKRSVSRRVFIVCVLNESQFAWSCIFCSSVPWLGYGGICNKKEIKEINWSVCAMQTTKVTGRSVFMYKHDSRGSAIMYK